MSIEAKLKNIIVSVSKRPLNAESIDENTVLTSDLGFDSIQIIELIVNVETEFGFELEDNDLNIDELTVYGKLKQIVSSKL